MHHSGSGLDDQLHLSVVEVDHVDQGEVGTEDPQVGQVFDRPLPIQHERLGHLLLAPGLMHHHRQRLPIRQLLGLDEKPIRTSPRAEERDRGTGLAASAEGKTFDLFVHTLQGDIGRDQERLCFLGGHRTEAGVVPQLRGHIDIDVEQKEAHNAPQPHLLDRGRHLLQPERAAGVAENGGPIGHHLHRREQRPQVVLLGRARSPELVLDAPPIGRGLGGEPTDHLLAVGAHVRVH